ncbi:hypothetical protein MTO96_034099 [Rhipicephalus appendiculatus]
MAAASDPIRYLLKGFDDVLDGRRICLVHELPASVAVCSLCSTVPSEHYLLKCGHAFCRPCFFGSVRKSAAFLRCPLDSRQFRPRAAVPPGHHRPGSGVRPGRTLLEQRARMRAHVHLGEDADSLPQLLLLRGDMFPVFVDVTSSGPRLPRAKRPLEEIDKAQCRCTLE